MPNPSRACFESCAREDENRAHQGLKWPLSTESVEVIYSRLAGANIGKTPWKEERKKTPQI